MKDDLVCEWAELYVVQGVCHARQGTIDALHKWGRPEALGQSPSKVMCPNFFGC